MWISGSWGSGVWSTGAWDLTETENEMNVSALDIINGALRLLEVSNPSETLSASEAAQGLYALNDLLDSWSNENLLIYDVTRESFNLTPGHNPHTWGIGGDLNSARPQHLLSVRTAGPSGVEYPCEIVSYSHYQAILVKSITSPYPRYAYIENAFPLAKLYLYPVPSAIGPLITMAEKAFTTFDNLTDLVAMPPGWARALRFSLAAELAPEYQVSAGPDIQTSAVQAKNNLKRMGNKPSMMGVDPAVIAKNRRRFNIYTNETMSS